MFSLKINSEPQPGGLCPEEHKTFLNICVKQQGDPQECGHSALHGMVLEPHSSHSEIKPDKKRHTRAQKGLSQLFNTSCTENASYFKNLFYIHMECHSFANGMAESAVNTSEY